MAASVFIWPGSFQNNGSNIIFPVGLPLDYQVAGLANVPTDGLILEDTLAATALATVQMTPRLRLSGFAWNSVGVTSELHSWTTDALPATNAGTTTSTFRIGVSVAGGAFTFPFSLSDSGSLTLLAGGIVTFQGRSFIRSTANGLLSFNNNALSVAVEVNIGSAAPSFNNGTLTTKSNNVCGEVTLTGGNTGGILTFGAPNWSNQPFVVVSGSAATDTPNVTAISTAAFTVAGITANGKFRYLVLGGL